MHVQKSFIFSNFQAYALSAIYQQEPTTQAGKPALAQPSPP